MNLSLSFNLMDNAITETHDGEDAVMPIVNPEELVGHTSGITNPDGQVDKFKIVEALEKHEAHTQGSPIAIQFKSSVDDDTREDNISYNDIMNYLECDENTEVMWKFKNILAHHVLFN